MFSNGLRFCNYTSAVVYNQPPQTFKTCGTAAKEAQESPRVLLGPKSEGSNSSKYLELSLNIVYTHSIDVFEMFYFNFILLLYIYFFCRTGMNTLIYIHYMMP